MTPPSRRAILRSLLAAATLAAAPRARSASAATSPRRRVLFVLNLGGWDPFNITAPLWDRPYVQLPGDAVPATSGGLAWVDRGLSGPRAFFDTWHAHTHLLHGLHIPSVAHEACTRALLLGRQVTSTPDWPTRIGAASPHLPVPTYVLGGPSFPGADAPLVARAGANGQLQGLLDGSLLRLADAPGPGPLAADVRAAVDAAAARRARDIAAARNGMPVEEQTAAWSAATDRALLLVDSTTGLSLFAGDDLPGQLAVATGLFSRDLASVAVCTSQPAGSWDSHADNDLIQGAYNDALFAALDRLLGDLAGTPGPSGGTLLDETVVVVLSEMGRTPLYNTKGGRDHWPFGPALFAGAGVRGDATSGGWSDTGHGLPFDFTTGQPDPAGALAEAPDLGATLLSLAGLDPAAVPDGRVLPWVLA